MERTCWILCPANCRDRVRQGKADKDISEVTWSVIEPLILSLAAVLTDNET